MDNVFCRRQCLDEPLAQVQTGTVRKGRGRSRQRRKTPGRVRDEVYHGEETWRSPMKEAGIEHQPNAATHQDTAQEQVLLVKEELKGLELRELRVKRRPRKTPDRSCSLPIVMEKLEEESGYEVIPQQEQVLLVKEELKGLELRESRVKRRPRKTPDRSCSLPIVMEMLEEESGYEVIPQQEQVLLVKEELKGLELRESRVKRRPRKTPDRSCSLPIVMEMLEEESGYEVIPQQEQVLLMRETPVKRRPRRTPDPRCLLPVVMEEVEEELGHEVIPQVPEATEPTRNWWSRIRSRGINQRDPSSVAAVNIEGPQGGATPISASARLKKTCSRLAAALAQLLCFRCCCGQLEE